MSVWRVHSHGMARLLCAVSGIQMGLPEDRGLSSRGPGRKNRELSGRSSGGHKTVLPRGGQEVLGAESACTVFGVIGKVYQPRVNIRKKFLR
jgi:hypothetical protein